MSDSASFSARRRNQPAMHGDSGMRLIPSRRLQAEARELSGASRTFFAQLDADSRESMGLATPLAGFLYWLGVALLLRSLWDDYPNLETNSPTLETSPSESPFSLYGFISISLSFIIELCISDTAAYLKNIFSIPDFELYVEQVKQARPKIAFAIANFHYETRWRTVYTTVGHGANARTESHTESYQERVDSHRATAEYPVGEVADRTYGFRQKLQARLESVRRRATIPAEDVNLPSAPPDSSSLSEAPTLFVPPDVSESVGALESEELCVICLDRPSSTAYLPCGHKVTCAGCGPTWLQRQGALPTCPVCRATIEECINIFPGEVVARGEDGVMRVCERVAVIGIISGTEEAAEQISETDGTEQISETDGDDFVLIEFRQSVKPLNRATEAHFEAFREYFYARNTTDAYQDKTESENIVLSDGNPLKQRVIVAQEGGRKLQFLSTWRYYVYVLCGLGTCYRRRLVKGGRKENWWVTKLFGTEDTSLGRFFEEGENSGRGRRNNAIGGGWVP